MHTRKLDVKMPTLRSYPDPASKRLGYHYSTLQPGEFRIALLHPADYFDAPVSFELVSSTDYGGEYNTISYTWGNPDFVYEEISLEENKVHYRARIPRNLHNALRHFRLKDRVRAIWADAMCINMDDLDERSRQIPMMLKVFQRASKTCVWLGEETSTIRLAVNFILQITQSTDVDGIVRSADLDEQWNAVNSLLSCTWFHRIWIVPEISVTRAATLYCGALSLDWADLETCIDIFQYASETTFNSDLTPLPGAVQLIKIVKDIFRRNHIGEPLQPLLKLEELVVRLAYMDSTDPRDRIYALVPLANDTGYWDQKNGTWDVSLFDPSTQENTHGPASHESEAFEGESTTGGWKFPIDYHQSAVAVFNDFVEFVVQDSGSWDILFQPWAPVGNWPSWISQINCLPFRVNEWGTSKAIRANAKPFVGLPRQPSYNASAGMEVKSAARHFQSDRLSINGVVVNAIETGMLAQPAWQGVMPPEWLSRGNVLPGAVPDAFWRTLVADRDTQRRKCPTYYARAFANLDLSEARKTGVNFALIAEEQTQSIQGEFWQRAEEVVWNRALVVLPEGSFGLVPFNSEEGDLICILFGASVPVVLRADSAGDASDFQLIGECYVHGMMDGEAIKSGTLSTETKHFNITAQVAHQAKIYPSLSEQTSFYLTGSPEQQSKTSRTKPVTVSDAMQYRLHWICSCNYRGFCTHTEFQPGVIEDLAQRMSSAGFRVTLEPLGLKNPTTDVLTMFGYSLFVFFNNIVADFRSAILDSTAEKDEAAQVIQRAYREYRLLQRRKEEKAAIIIQRTYRKYKLGQQKNDPDSLAWTRWRKLFDDLQIEKKTGPVSGRNILKYKNRRYVRAADQMNQKVLGQRDIGWKMDTPAVEILDDTTPRVKKGPEDSQEHSTTSIKLPALKSAKSKPYRTRPQQSALQQSSTQQSASQQSTPQAPPPAYLPPSNTAGGIGTNTPLQSPPSIGVATGPPPPPNQPPDLKYLLLCMRESEHLVTREDVDVSALVYDQQVFRRIATAYRSKRRRLQFGRLKAWLGVQRLLTISFVKFGFVEGLEVNNLQAPKLPRPRITFYDFKPRTSPLPPYDNDAMMHRYANPGHCGTSKKFFEQMPKRKERRPDPGRAPDMFTGWGLYLMDGPDFRRLARSAMAIYGISFIASFTFGLVWSLASPNKSVGDAWTTAAYISTTALAAIGILAIV